MENALRQAPLLDCGVLDDLPLRPLTAAGVRRAAQRQKGRGDGLDHWRRDELRALPEEAYEGLAVAYALVEEEGAFPDRLRATLEVLFGKGRGEEPLDQRNIGLLPRLYRVWAAARQGDVREWREQSGHTWSWGAGRGRGSGDAAWHSAFAAEVAKARRRAYGQLLFDCRQCYERVPLQVAAGAAAAESFPGRLARVALKQYAAPRALRHAGALSNWTLCRRGLVAGCGLAGDLLRCTLARPARAVQEAAPGATLRLVMDDCTVEAEGTSTAVGCSLRQAADTWRAEVESLEGELNVGKTKLLANGPRARRALRKAMAGSGIDLADEARDLGVDAAASAKRRLRTQAQRVRRTVSKAGRFKRVRGPARKKRGIAAGLNAGALFGVECLSMAAGPLLRVRRAVAQALVGKAKGRRCLTAELALCGPDADPAVQMHARVLYRWARAVWEATVSEEGQKVAWQAALGRRTAGRLPICRVRGPAAATIYSLSELGWEPLSPTNWRRPEGILDLKLTAPRRVREMAAEAARRALWAATARRRPRDSAGIEGGVDLSAVIRELRGAPPMLAGALRCVVTGATSTAARRERQGGDVDARCSRCDAGAEEDERHRFWECSCPDRAEARRAAGLSEEFAQLMLDEAPPAMACRGLLPAEWTSVEARPAPLPGGMPQGWWHQDASKKLAGVIATDGAADEPTDPRFRRAAWGFVAEEGGRRRWGPLAGEPQTVFRAELTAVIEVLRALDWERGATILIDNTAVVQALRRILAQDSEAEGELAGAGNADADLWREALGLLRGREQAVEVIWVPSHTLDPGLTDPQRFADRLRRARQQPGWHERFRDLNRLADLAAAAGLRGHALPREAVQKIRDRDEQAGRAVRYMAGLVVQEAAAEGNSEGRRRVAWRGPTGRPRGRPPAPMQPGPTPRGHDLEERDGRWQCRRCGRWADTAHSRRCLRSSQCRAEPAPAQGPDAQ